jgi:hypothetical protein
LVPVTASEMSGKNVPQKITKHIAISRMFCSRKAASRDSSESILCSDLSASRRHRIRPIELTIITTISARNGPPSVEAPKAWIESRIPERTRNVPMIASVPVASTREAFHTFSIPRFSWIMIEWMNAVPVSQGISDAFSTGSQAQ